MARRNQLVPTVAYNDAADRAYREECAKSGADPDARGRDRATHTARSDYPWENHANTERDDTGNTTMRAPIEGADGEKVHKPRLSDGFSSRRRY